MQQKYINRHIDVVPDTWSTQQDINKISENPCAACPDNPINKPYNPFNNGVCNCDLISESHLLLSTNV